MEATTSMSRKPLKVESVAAVLALHWYVAKEEGLFTAEGLEVEIVTPPPPAPFPPGDPRLVDPRLVAQAPREAERIFAGKAAGYAALDQRAIESLLIERARSGRHVVRLKGGDAAIRVESPGYACPTWADVDGDGKKDLIVGQFAKGKMQVFKNLGGMKFDKGTWLEAEGKVAEVPGVW